MAAEAVPPNPSGLCQCGCGQRTELAPRKNKQRGWIKGQPKRYINGHQSRKNLPLYTVDEETGCWPSPRGTNPKGYPMMRVPGEKNMKLVHRVVYERVLGKIPEPQLHHKCENKRCCNPDHLQPTNQPKHSRLHRRKLAIEDARMIRMIYAQGEITQKALAATFGVSPALVSFIVTNHYWKELPNE